jgi:outer membrane protein TolC
VKIPHVESGLPADLLLRRPDVQEAERLLAAANANISVARKNFLPSIALTGTGGAQSVALASAVGAPAAIFNFGLSTLQPIFSGGRLRGSLDYANGRYAELAAGYARAVQQALGDTEDALATVSGEDLTDTLPLLLAQQSLASAHSSYIDARLNRVLGAVALYKALGGGWQKP